MTDKKYATEREVLSCSGYHVPISHTVAGRKPLARVLLGPGLNDSGSEIYDRIGGMAALENIDIVRFTYPADLGQNWFRPRLQVRRNIISCLLELLVNETEEDVPLLIGGRSLSAYLCSGVQHPRISGYIFFSYPMKLPRVRVSLPAAGLKRLRKPILFVQGRLDDMAPVRLVEERIRSLDPHAYLLLLPEADHRLRGVVDGKRSDEEILEEIGNVFFWFLSEVLARRNMN